ncbi:MAG: ABC transporter ATP-binding protein [Nitrospira sp. SB0672_bin_25]|nr:ABC transporter ATP-binding protein [Nitrospira sp. SB0666_bin_27]MYC27859.1 ABC transporter ATP-binding protein [Nitrospira sp. SB0662_bin_26]MYF25696.1 ABC transporter ATP-binding protein [Nitrospira sp. SB0678_bin_10]MYJ53598.1 ABC transporter ATP-binding protein [Nitrospira sp. SB0672_bin_25]
MATSIIDIQKVSHSYFRDDIEIPVLKQLTLNIEPASFVALLGPSGSGKTTILNLMAGFDRPMHGRISINQINVSQLSERQLARWRAKAIGFIFQFYNLIPVLTAAENVELPLLLTSLSRAQRAKHVATALRLVGLGDRMTHYPRQLSGGQEQRVAIARAIVMDPAILLADEPTGNLDSEAAEEIMILLQRLNAEQGKTIVLVTHDLEAAQRATTICKLQKGRLV